MRGGTHETLQKINRINRNPLELNQGDFCQVIHTGTPFTVVCRNDNGNITETVQNSNKK